MRSSTKCILLLFSLVVFLSEAQPPVTTAIFTKNYSQAVSSKHCYFYVLSISARTYASLVACDHHSPALRARVFQSDQLAFFACLNVRARVIRARECPRLKVCAYKEGIGLHVRE